MVQPFIKSTFEAEIANSSNYISELSERAQAQAQAHIDRLMEDWKVDHKR